MSRFDLSNHVCKLVADDWMVNETFAKSLALVSILFRKQAATASLANEASYRGRRSFYLEAFFNADASKAICLDNNTHTLSIEVPAR